MPESKTCKWHQCGATFTPARKDQEFCSRDCAKARMNWKRMRGAVVVDLLLEFNLVKLSEHRQQLKKEIADGKPTP